MAASWCELSALVSEVRDAIVGLRFDGTIASWNFGAQELFDYSADEVVGKPFSILTADGTRDVRAIADRLTSGCAVSDYMNTLRSKAGKVTRVLIAVSAVRSPTGEPLGLANVIRPVGLNFGATLNPNIAAAAEELIRFVAQRSQRRTALTEELRQPLTAVIAYLEAINGGRVSDIDNLKIAVGRAHEQASRAGKIMHLLSEYEPYDLDLDEVVQLIGATFSTDNTAAQLRALLLALDR